MISECASYTNTLSAGIDMMKEVDVAGVVCQKQQSLAVLSWYRLTVSIVCSEQLLYCQSCSVNSHIAVSC